MPRPVGDSCSAYRIKGHIGVTPFDPECLKKTAEEFCEEYHVKLLYHLLLISCESDSGRISRALDQLVRCAVRVMPPCIAMGQAAGTAAAMTVRNGQELRELDSSGLRAQLIADGMMLE